MLKALDRNVFNLNASRNALALPLQEAICGSPRSSFKRDLKLPDNLIQFPKRFLVVHYVHNIRGLDA